jgi:LmbE family N-acetylglucosaminyl deacetylase
VTILYVSPHLDDVALSCAGALVTRAATGEHVVVATVFTDGHPARAYARRRAEDRAVLRVHGADAVHLGFADAPSRLGLAPSFRSLLLGPPVAPGLVADVAASLAALQGRLAPREVWLPLGVGGHIDHRVTFAAGTRSAGPRRFYEERPYAFSPVLRRLRAMELFGATPPAGRDATQITADLEAHGCGALAGEDERAAVGRLLARRLARHPRPAVWRSRTARHDYRGSMARAALRLVAGYAAETRWLFGGEDLLALYTRLAPAGPGAFWERTTRLTPIRGWPAAGLGGPPPGQTK